MSSTEKNIVEDVITSNDETPFDTEGQGQKVTDEEYPEPSEEETDTLRKVAGTLPLVSFSLCLVEFAERASYFGAQTVFSNFIEFGLPKGGNGSGAPPRGTQQTAGALGMGLQASSGLVLLFAFLAYIIPLFGGWWADVHVGRYKAICIGVLICGIAHIIQVVGAIPSVLKRGTSNSAPPFIIGLLLLALGAGIFKPNIAPTILDQHRCKKPYTKVLKTGEKVIIDPELTSSRTMLIYYGFINVGAFYMLATTYAEKYVGYWLSFLLAGAIYFLLPVLLALVYKKTYKVPPSGTSDLSKAVKIISMALKRNKFRVWKKGFFDAARPSVLAAEGIQVEWTDRMVDDVRRTLVATELFFYFPIYNINDGGIGSVLTNQGASMTTNGAPQRPLEQLQRPHHHRRHPPPQPRPVPPPSPLQHQIRPHLPHHLWLLPRHHLQHRRRYRPMARLQNLPMRVLRLRLRGRRQPHHDLVAAPERDSRCAIGAVL
ncbi:hypothetical protein AWENTII_009969 [Aspergillus wentii]